jgi:hypothetical protein
MNEVVVILRAKVKRGTMVGGDSSLGKVGFGILVLGLVDCQWYREIRLESGSRW